MTLRHRVQLVVRKSWAVAMFVGAFGGEGALAIAVEI
jgi:hypothetical protein